MAIIGAQLNFQNFQLGATTMKGPLFFFLSLILLSGLTGTSSLQGQESTIKTLDFYVSSHLLGSDSASYLAINIENTEGWHTYWENPGDAGTPLEFTFATEQNESIELEAMPWPAPIRYLQDGEMWGYGYAKSYSFFFKIGPSVLEKIKNKAIVVKGTWLACNGICVPGQKDLLLYFDSNGQITNSQPTSLAILAEEIIIERFNALPTIAELPLAIDIALAVDSSRDSGMLLYYTLTGVDESAIFKERNLLTPFPHPPFTFKHESLYKDGRGNIYGKLALDWDGEYMDPEIPLPADGNFPTAYKLKFLFTNPISQKIEIVEKEFNSFEQNADERINSLFAVLEEIKTNASTSTNSATSDAEIEAASGNKENSIDDSSLPTTTPSSLGWYLLLAFLGGLILNVMPCVLPVISLKLFSLLKNSQEDRGVILKHNLFYTLGVVASFLALATILAFLKESTEGVGWGFQLQSPLFVIFMIEILFIFSLNLFGLFEFQTPGGAVLGGAKLPTGALGDFANGVFATILATPCSAPVLGSALAFAFASSTATLFFVFLTIGLGLAFPFIVTGIFPAMIKLLPRPGMWMEHLKKFLALSLLLTIVWLMDVLFTQVESILVFALLNLLLTFTFFAFYLRRHMSKKIIWQLLFFAIPLTLLAFLSYSAISPAQQEDVAWIPWSEEKMEEFKKEHRPVFIDFTAKWCFTCKVNEKLVLESKAFDELVAKYHLALLLGDWTKSDPLIGNWLKAHNKAGVPAYFIQKSSGELISLDETISIGEIEKLLEE